MKKVIMTLILIVTIIIFSGCGLNKEKDAVKFKEEYESLNGIKSPYGNEYRAVTISEDNPFVYKGADDIVKMIKNKETFAVYFGFNSCPWCRSVVPTLVEVAKDNEIENIYYVDVKDIRDTIEITEDGELKTTKKGTDGYYKLIELFSNVLDDYTLVDSEGNQVSTNEKRIYAPNVVVVIDGVAEKLETGISDKQTNSNIELTDEMINDTYNKYNSILEYLYANQNTCGVGC